MNRAATDDAAGGLAALAAGWVRDGDILRRVHAALVRQRCGPVPVPADGDGTGGSLPRRDPDPGARFDPFARSGAR